MRNGPVSLNRVFTQDKTNRWESLGPGLAKHAVCIIPSQDEFVGTEFVGTDPAKRAVYRDFRDLNPLNGLGIG